MIRMRKGSKALCMLTAICVMAATVTFIHPKESYGADNSQAQYLEAITISATVKPKSYLDYDEEFYKKIMSAEYDTLYTEEDKALVIEEAEELAAFAKAVNEGRDFNGKYAKLGQTINLGGTAPKIENQQESTGDKFKIVVDNPNGSETISNIWAPIGTYSSPFLGTFDGKGNKIQGMVVCVTGTGNSAIDAGFFGYVGGSATIKDLGIENACVIVDSTNGSADAGVLAGNNQGSITSSYGSGRIYVSAEYANNIGGLIGYNQGSITGSYGSSEVYAFASSSGYTNAGGLAGNNQSSGNITSSYGGGRVCASAPSSSANAGGLVGYNNYGRIESSYGSGGVSAFGGGDAAAGGLVGYNVYAEIISSYRNSDAKVTARKGGETMPMTAEVGTPLTRQEMTGTGTGRADQNMTGFPASTWTFETDSSVRQEGARYYRNCYFPRLKGISYTEASKPQYQKEAYRLDQCIQVQITGEVIEGTVLSADIAPKAGSPATVSSPTYQWQVGGNPVPGAVKPTYLVMEKDVGKTVKVVVTDEDFYGSVTATAKQPSASVKPNPSGKLEKPSLEISATYNSVKLSWKNVKGADGYQVYRATKKNGSYKKVKTTKSKFWTNQSLTTGKAYYYKVRAYQKEGSNTVYGSFSKTVKAVPRTKAPSFKLTAGNNKMKVKWNKVSGADGYKIYRARSKNGKYRMVKDSQSRVRSYTSIRLSDHHKYYYKMRSYKVVKGKKVYSDYSNVKSKRTR